MVLLHEFSHTKKKCISRIPVDATYHAVLSLPDLTVLTIVRYKRLKVLCT